MSLYLYCVDDIYVTVPVLCGYLCHRICTVWMIYMSLYLYCVDDRYVTVPVLCG